MSSIRENRWYFYSKSLLKKKKISNRDYGNVVASRLVPCWRNNSRILYSDDSRGAGCDARHLLLRAFERYARRRYDTSLLPVVIILHVWVNVIQEHRYTDWVDTVLARCCFMPRPWQSIQFHIILIMRWGRNREGERFRIWKRSTCFSFSAIIPFISIHIY